jgi:hypothetical protein
MSHMFSVGLFSGADGTLASVTGQGCRTTQPSHVGEPPIGRQISSVGASPATDCATESATGPAADGVQESATTGPEAVTASPA